MAPVCNTDSAAGTCSQKLKRKRYSRKFKLKVVTFYRENNLYQTSKFFSLNTKTILRWARDEEKIEKAKKGSKHVQHHRRAMHPEMEAELYREYKQLRKQGLKVKGYWFKVRAKQLLTEMDPEASFHSLMVGSFRRSRNVAQKSADDKQAAIQGFHRNIRQIVSKGRQIGPLGELQPHQIANVHVDQTPLPFCFSEGTTCADVNSVNVAVQ